VQVTSLTRLQRLTLREFRCDLGSYAALLQLSTLTALHMATKYPEAPLQLPACLPQLTSLKVLRLVNSEQHDMELARALPSLQQLTALGFDQLTSSVAATLPTLPQLSVFACSAADDAALPAGAWLARLRLLAAPAKLVTGGPLQEGAEQLELAVGFAHDQAVIAELVQWAHQRSQLRTLLVDVSSCVHELGTAQPEQLCAAQCGEPGLAIARFESYRRLKREAAKLAPVLAELMPDPHRRNPLVCGV
jgi:hypothetical protein